MKVRSCSSDSLSRFSAGVVKRIEPPLRGDGVRGGFFPGLAPWAIFFASLREALGVVRRRVVVSHPSAKYADGWGTHFSWWDAL